MKYIIVTFFLFLSGIGLTNAQDFPPPPPPPDKDNVDNMIFTKVDVEAAFPGGDAGWRNYLMENIRTKKIARKIFIPKGTNKLVQTVIVKFIVDKNGNISNAVAENNDVDLMCITEAVRVIKISPKWIPAKQNGRMVNAYRRQPITFSFER